MSRVNAKILLSGILIGAIFRLKTVRQGTSDGTQYLLQVPEAFAPHISNGNR